MDEQFITGVAQALPKYKHWQVKAALTLLDEGNTIPFIARYRKEQTGVLDEVALQEIQETAHRQSELAARKATVLKAISAAGKLSPALEAKITAAPDLATVEDLYLPYKQKRRTKAQKAREAGLQPLANWLLTYADQDPAEKAAEFVTEEITDPAAALAGAHEILAEGISELATVRAWLRNFAQQQGQLAVTVKKDGEEKDERQVYRQYYDFSEPVRRLDSYQVLAINRGEKEGVLRVKLALDAATVQNYLNFRLINKHEAAPSAPLVAKAAADAYKRFLLPAIEREVRNDLTAMANEQGIKVFGENLYHLLMQAPLKGRVVLGFDPAYRTGCKLAVLDPNGKLVKVAVIYPHKPAPEGKRQAAMGEFIQLLEDYRVETVAIGNGTASRESEQFVAEAIKQLARPVSYVIVNEAGASVYSASAEARAEFPDLTVEKRSAISIGRRLQDPLAELVKIDPQAIGVGQYQHDLPEAALKAELAAVIERAVNRVGVNLNTASAALLTHVAGLSAAVAKEIVAYREEKGAYTNRRQLLKVPRLGPKAYKQAAGFLRIRGGENPLDNTEVHPESYPLAKQVLVAAKLTAADLGTDSAKQALAALDPQAFVTDGAGLITVKDVINSLAKPGRDPRDTMPAPLLRTDVLTIEDLKPGMELQGTVRNVVDFGAFVDLGVKHDGLVHRTQFTKQNRLVEPRSQVAVGDIVTVWVKSVDLARERIQLTMIKPKGQQDD